MRPLWPENWDVAVVVCGDATTTIKNGQQITVSCAEGKEGNVYVANWNGKSLNRISANCPTRNRPHVYSCRSGKSFELSYYPNKGVGLMRMEFAISNSIKIHPLCVSRRK
jgi:pyruvate,water dikinase